MKIIHKFLLLLFCNLIFFTAQANDSAGTTAAGGIAFTKMPSISMDREELNISPTKIKVTYLFKNNSDKDITTQVFFPIPPYKQLGANTIWDTEIAPQNNPHAPFINFSVTAQGQAVQFNVDERATMNGQDITQALKNAGIPLNPDLVAGNIPLPDASKVSQWQTAAKQLGYLDDSNKPKWQKQVTYYWTQTFPAQQVVLIEHEYRPSVGMFYGAANPGQDLGTLMNENIERMKSLFSINIDNLNDKNVFKNWLTQQIQQNISNPNSIYAYFYNVNYILTTGANWGGPIKNFALTIATPENGIMTFNKFYGNKNVSKENNPQSITLYINNFIPKQDLQILYATATQMNLN